jgi:sec-independent protein translocase protein TatB
MLDIGFSELMVIGVVALVVLGPERLPRVARTAGHLLGRFQRYVTQVKADINREIELADLKKLQTSVEDAARDIETSVKTGMDEAEQQLRSAEKELDQVQSAVRSAVPQLDMPHMGMGAGLGGASSSAPAEGATLASAPQPAAGDGQPSPQMELELPQGAAADQTKQA